MEWQLSDYGSSINWYMRLITKDDFVDIYQKAAQRGLSFVLSKFNPDGPSRTKSAFDNSSLISSNWWTIPAVRERWNMKITGDKRMAYEEYSMATYLRGRQNLKMLSIGSGVCSHELTFAAYPHFSKIVCVDIAANLLQRAQEVAHKKGLSNISFLEKDIYTTDFDADEFDIVLFHSSLHHLSNIEDLISGKVIRWLKPDGLLIINEYVGANRLQYSRDQINYINKGLRLIPSRLKKRYRTNLIKKTYSGSGYLRMVIADPSECVESSNILPVLHSHFKTIEEKSYGGNLLMSILKDIAHNFMVEDDLEAREVLGKLFELEDAYLIENKSDFVFGIYKHI